MIAASATTSPTTNPWHNAPSSAEVSLGNLGGACALLALLVQTQSTTQAGSKTDVELGAHQLAELKKQLADAVQQAKEAAEHSGFFGFLGDVFGGDIAKIAGAVAAVAAAVATAGTATPLLLVALSAALEAGAKLGPELGLDPKICMALSLASAAVGICSGAGAAQGVSALAVTARAVETGAQVTEGTATVAGGVLQGVSGYYQQKQLKDQADAAGYQASTEATELDIDDAFARLERALRGGQHEISTASETVQAQHETNTALIDRI